MAKHKYIQTPEIMWELFEEYKNNNKDISIKGFQKFCKNIIGCVQKYFFPKYYIEFNDIIEKIKTEIFNHKLEKYNLGKLHHQKLCRDASIRGIKLNQTFQFVDTTENQFEIQNGIITIKDSFLKKKSHTAYHKMSIKIPDTIYILNVSGTNIYKIGVTQNYNRRIKDLQSATPFIIDVILIKKVLFAYELEQSIHEEIKHLHIKNEWFKINDIQYIINKIHHG